MGNSCCSSENYVVGERKDGDDGEQKEAETAKRTKTLMTGTIGSRNNVIVPNLSLTSSPKKKKDGNNNDSAVCDSDRRDSDATIYFDALDRFPSFNDMRYPPADSMRQLPVEVDMFKPDVLPMLLNPSSRCSLQVDPPSSNLREPKRKSLIKVSEHLATESPGTQGRGYPGELTEEELEACLEFREQLKTKHPAFKEMVMSMHPHEPEAFALCRILRARNFVIDDVFTMMSEKNQLENWNIAKDTNFFEDFHDAIPEFNGCPLAVLMTQFPLLHYGIGKNGAIVLYVKVGEVNCPGIECIVGDIANAVPYAWNRLYHGARNAIERESARSDPATTTVLAEKIIVVDLNGDSTLFSAGLDLLKAGPAASSCFPETVNRTYILNASFSFSVAWAVIKRLLDPRTVQKIGFFSTIAKAKADFLDHIETENLLSSYGGTGNSFEEVMALRQRELAHKPGIVRYIVEVVTINGKSLDFPFQLLKEEKVDSIVLYSRSDNMCEISIEGEKGEVIVEYTTISREQATDYYEPQDVSRNNYSIEVGSAEDFRGKNPSGSFVANIRKGTKGDHFLVAISIAEN